MNPRRRAGGEKPHTELTSLKKKVSNWILTFFQPHRLITSRTLSMREGGERERETGEREKETERQRDGETDRETETDRQKERQRQRATEVGDYHLLCS